MASDSEVAIKYRDNKVVTFAFNFENSEIGTTKRFFKQFKNYISYFQLVTVKNYNSYMGDID